MLEAKSTLFSAAHAKSHVRPRPATLNRTPFATSRLLEFLSEKELVAQTGHQPAEWPLVVVKELLDNSLDACEEASTAPKISLTVDQAGLTVADNGPGIPPHIVRRLTDFSIRVSAREAYVSPTRGLQGNALKTMLGIPYALDGNVGAVTIEACGVRHTIRVRLDRIRQLPLIEHTESEIDQQVGTKLQIAWPNSPGSIPPDAEGEFLQNGSPQEARSPRSILHGAKARFLQIADDFLWMNPHLALSWNWHGEVNDVGADCPEWRKWLPTDPTDPHWYELDDLERLAAAYIAHDSDAGRDRTVREFVSEFRGLSGTAKVKGILDGIGLSRSRLADLASKDGIDRKRLGRLLAAMKQACRPVKPEALGIIGEQHLAARCAAIGAEMKSFKYLKRTGVNGELPWILETAFAWCPQAQKRRLITGVNWSPGILNPFRQLGLTGESLDSILEEQRAGYDEPTVVFLHLACPRVRYADRGKSSVIVEQ